MSRTVEANLDHVVLLLPYADLISPPPWLTDNFTLSPGGRHADGKTENRLVLFRDGTYLELIAFVDDDAEKRRGHWWDKPYGIVDFALGVPDGDHLDYPSLRDRLAATNTGFSYAPPRPGGRTKPDGTELQWHVTFPTAVSRGVLPFWCTDVTPRDRRVPVTEANSAHPSGVQGMAGVLVELDAGRVQDVSAATAAVVDLPLHAGGKYEIGVPQQVEGLKAPSIRLQGAEDARLGPEARLTLVLQTPRHLPREAVREEIGDGVVSITFE